MARVQVWAFQCERCEHVWLPRDKDREPKVCPKCKSPYWNTPRRRAATGVAGDNQKKAAAKSKATPAPRKGSTR